MKAIIPIAGQGTRMMPLTCILPKALFPLVDADGKLKTVLQILLEQVKQADVDEVAIIASPGQQNMLADYFDIVRQQKHEFLPSTICCIEQQNPLGFGDAVSQARDFIGKQPFLLLLGDHIHIQTSDKPPCIQQVKGAFRQHSVKAMIGVHPVSEQALSLVGVASGDLINSNTYRCTNFVEKLSLQQAQTCLKTKDLVANHYLGHCGIYAFDPIFFDYLDRVTGEAKRNKTEAELAHAQSLLLDDFPSSYYLHRINGTAYDTGTPNLYAQAFFAFRNNGLTIRQTVQPSDSPTVLLSQPSNRAQRP